MIILLKWLDTVPRFFLKMSDDIPQNSRHFNVNSTRIDIMNMATEWHISGHDDAMTWKSVTCYCYLCDWNLHYGKAGFVRTEGWIVTPLYVKEYLLYCCATKLFWNAIFWRLFPVVLSRFVVRVCKVSINTDSIFSLYCYRIYDVAFS